MLKIHTSDGETVRIDLRDPEQAREWLTRLEADSFQASISGVSLVSYHSVSVRCAECQVKTSSKVGVQYSLSRPQKLSGVRYGVERVEVNGRHHETVTVTAGDVLMSIVAHETQPSARVSLIKAGTRRYAPKRYTRIEDTDGTKDS